MTAANRRIVRMLCKASLLVSLPLAGFVWALPETNAVMAIAGVLTVLSLAVGFGAEYLASSTENDIREVSQRIAAQAQRRAADLEIRDENIRQFDRIVNLLTEQNNTLRSNLVALQIEVQRKREALVQAVGQAVAMEDAQPLRVNYARAH